MKDYSALEFIGFAVLLDGDVIGFTIGEQLNRETVVVHFEKGDYRYPGIYQYINQKFADAMLGKFKYINREQDLGIPGLRKAKESYHPIAMVEKFTCIKRA
ncbi:MAG: phosphatidylglycerol lysyltransferase domain-containing protein [Thermoplasmata archaeon]